MLLLRMAFLLATSVAAGQALTAADKASHWAFQPVREPSLPAVRDSAWIRSPVDAFILARLEQEGWAPSTEAERGPWLRRVSYDLIGLPPTPEEMAAFEADQRPDAHEREVERLLTSPRYGERWGQHWLDLVRYADTHGFEVNTERPNAWPYRDYVIGVFNRDVPYDRFIREQVAGDLAGADAALGFLVTASALLPGQIGADDASKRQARQDELDEIVINTSQTFLGLSVGCARCHDHKFDPISLREYYSMQAFFAGIVYGDREMRTPEAETLRGEAVRLKARIEAIDAELTRFEPVARPGLVSPPENGARPMVNSGRNTERFAPVRTKRVRFTIRKTNNLEPCIDELEIFDTASRNLALASAGARVTSSGDSVTENRHELRLVNDGRYGNSSSWMSSETGAGWLLVELAEETEIERVVWGRDRLGEFTDRLAIEYIVEVEEPDGGWRRVSDSADRKPLMGPAAAKPGTIETNELGEAAAERVRELQAERKSREKRLAEASGERLVFAGLSKAPDDTRILHRGNPEQPRDPVGPAVPAVLGRLSLERTSAETARREALAAWLTDPSNPLTARVMVNRIWQGHFGTGLVSTPSDFGRTGSAPTHPELLDWLAGEFVRGGWSIKRMHRLIVLSATYRQSSRLNPVAAAKDADGRLLWRYPMRRLESEPLRDSILAISGRLNLAMGGRGFDLFNLRGGLTGFNPVESFGPEGLRRMIYAHKVRREPEVVFGAFDCPDAGQSAARRRESTTPIQALNLLNSRFVLDHASAFAARVKLEAGDDPARQIDRAYRLALGRAATAGEIGEAVPVVAGHGLAPLCRALFNSNEFLHLP